MENDILLFDERCVARSGGRGAVEAVLDRLHADGRTLVIPTTIWISPTAGRTGSQCSVRAAFWRRAHRRRCFRDTRLMARTHLRPRCCWMCSTDWRRAALPAGAACPKTPDGLEALLGREK